MSNLIRYNT